jgi:hypothetical protein
VDNLYKIWNLVTLNFYGCSSQNGLPYRYAGLRTAGCGDFAQRACTRLGGSAVVFSCVSG